jgi:class 3 adenylate cyclase
LRADASAADGLVRGGMERSERQITVVFIDLRGSTKLGETRMPYDVLYILNQFFNEMTKALVATGGHYSNFTGDGLMALFGLDAPQPAIGAAQALRGAREMLAGLDQQPLTGDSVIASTRSPRRASKDVCPIGRYPNGLGQKITPSTTSARGEIPHEQ